MNKHSLPLDICKVIEFNTASLSKLLNLCSPLLKYLGISYFHYTVFFNDGRRLYLCTRPDWLKRSLDRTQKR